MLPGPGTFKLVFTEGFDVADQNSGTAAGPQPRINFIRFAGTGMRGQNVNDALTQAVIKVLS